MRLQMNIRGIPTEPQDGGSLHIRKPSQPVDPTKKNLQSLTVTADPDRCCIPDQDTAARSEWRLRMTPPRR